MTHETAILLHNIRSAHNVGSIFRSADGAGVSNIYLSGYSPLPVDAFGRPQKDIAKTALGAERFVSWARAPSAARLIAKLKKGGWQIVGVEQDARSVDYRSARIGQPTLILFGNEVRGLSPSLRTLCDTLIEIPMRGTKESLNVSVAAGIVLYALLDGEPHGHVARDGSGGSREA